LTPNPGVARAPCKRRRDRATARPS
jgi:hypothetical protein